MKFMEITKQFTIPKKLAMQAYQLVKANKGSPGIDQQTLLILRRIGRGIFINSGIGCRPEPIFQNL
jgi:hypothetical protein